MLAIFLQQSTNNLMQCGISLFVSLVAAFAGAFCAFYTNIQLNRLVKKEDKKAKLSALVVNTVVLVDRFLKLKRDVFLPRQKECGTIQREVMMKKQAIETQEIYKELFLGLQVSRINFDISMYNVAFIAEYDQPLYRLILTLNISTNDLNKIIEDLNSHINLLATKEKLTEPEIEILCSYTENATEFVDNCLYLSDIAIPLLVDLAKREFKPFDEIGRWCLEENRNLFPSKSYVPGWDDLYEKTLEIRQQQKN